MAALILILLVSFYHVQIAELFSMSLLAEGRLYSLGIFWAAAIGGYGVVLTTLGLILSPIKNDVPIRLTPLFLSICAILFLFFFLLSFAFESPPREEQRRLRPGETIDI